MEVLNAIFADGDIKINMEDSGAPKLPLLYVNDILFEKWLLIQENWFNRVLLDSFGNTLNKFGDVENDSNDKEVTQKKRK